jgi:hypothetical protein
MIYPSLGSQYLSDRHGDIKSRMEAFYSQAVTLNLSFWGQADTDARFEAGDQTVWADLYGNLPIAQSRQFSFNQIRRIKNMIGGHQRRSRKSTICVPVENADNLTADQFTKILMWINNREGVLETISESFDGALVTGLNFLHVWVDYRNDPVSGNIKVDKCSYNSFLVDPYFRKHDMSDCNAIWRRSFLTKRELISLFPDKSDIILSLATSDSGSNQDGKFQFMPETYNYGMRNLVAYDEFYYRDYRTQEMLVDSVTGDSLEWYGDQEVLDKYLQLYPQVEITKQEIPSVRLAIVAQGRLLYDGAQPSGIDEYPFVPVIAYFNPQLPYYDVRIQGVVRGLRDAQYLYNRRKVIELDILESQINSGFIYKENAVVNPLDLYTQQGQGKGIAIKSDANMSDVVQVQPPNLPPSMFQVSDALKREIMDISGANEELLGSATDDKAGILSMLRQGAGLTTLQILFDQLDRSQKLLGKRMLEIIQRNFTPGKIQNILQGEKPAPLFYKQAFGMYDCAVEEGLNTTTQKQLELAQRLQLRAAGVPISNEDIMDVVTMQGKDKIMQRINAAEQAQQQMQQEQHQAAIADQMARIKLSEARAAADQGLGIERLSRVEENEALAIERKAAAEKDHDMAILNLIKALKEVDGIDIDHISKLMAISDISRNRAKDTQAQDAAMGS